MVLLLMILQLAAVQSENFMIQGRAALKESRYADAEKYLTLAIEEAERARLKDTQLGVAYNDLAETYRRTGRYNEAKSIFEKSMALLRKNTEPTRELVTILNNAGALYMDTGQYMRSSELYEESLKAAKKALPPNDTLFGTIYNGLGLATSAKGDSGKA